MTIYLLQWHIWKCCVQRDCKSCSDICISAWTLSNGDQYNILHYNPQEGKYGLYLVLSLVKILTKITLNLLKTTGAALRNHLADCMQHLGYISSKANPDLWMNLCTTETPTGPEKYYFCMVVYIDGITTILVVFPTQAWLSRCARLRDGFQLMQLKKGAWAWDFSPSNHI